MSVRPRIVLATGGTGGHIYPAQALAEALLAAGAEVSVVTDRRGAAFGTGIDSHAIAAATLSGGFGARVGGATTIALGICQARRWLQRLKPAAVIGFGGYPSFPTMLAASWAGIPTLVHEQNAVLGRANRVLAGRVDRIATSFAEVRFIRPADRAKTVQTGNPVRPAFALLRETPYTAPVADGTLAILVLGGSQGARVFSRVLPEALALLPPALRARIKLTQQCRPEDLAATRAAVRAAGVDGELANFFDDVPQRLAGTHLVIARAGASTVAELTVAGRPAILVPYPFATDDHQTANAGAIDEAGAGWLIPEAAFHAEALVARLESVLAAPARLSQAAARMAGLGQPDATHRLAELALALARSRPGTGAADGPRNLAA
ncbi:MAG: undecaprenyldiphospho-muramoylpentapeptide beta-N-acetylglucosaminyltransferase [Alphaproteobacteria bacterium]|nr:undecaprenyldiphospho-muramoylpentapeptide beta-N-acetylglucosaminyltransferase [Alphaproteobacteria bacterium]